MAGETGSGCVGPLKEYLLFDVVTAGVIIVAAIEVNLVCHIYLERGDYGKDI